MIADQHGNFASMRNVKLSCVPKQVGNGAVELIGHDFDSSIIIDAHHARRRSDVSTNVTRFCDVHRAAVVELDA